MASPSSKSQSSGGKKWPLLWGGVLLVLAVLAGVFWVVLVNDTDFYRPSSVVRCEAPVSAAHPFRFVAYGDWGEGTLFQKALASELIRYYQQKPFQNVFLLGDNIYETGDINHYARDYFEIPYAPLIHGGVRFWPAIGDHDVKDDHMADQVRYFKVPGPYYKVGKGAIDFFFINTNNYALDRGQQAWLQKSLAESTALWKIVLGHHPMYSSGRHGDTLWVREKLEPLMLKYHVDLYLAGHDHDYERFRPIRGIHYVVSGGGGAFLTPFRKIEADSMVHLRTHHFLVFEIAGSEIWMKAINKYGDVIDCDHWRKSAVLPGIRPALKEKAS